MEEELVKITEYPIDRSIINKCLEEERNLKKEDLEGEFLQILKENRIDYKIKINEKWTKVSRIASSKYQLMAEIFVYKKDYENARNLLNNY